MPPNGVIPSGIGVPHVGYGGGRVGNVADPRYHGDWSREYPPETYRRPGAGTASVAPPGTSNPSIANAEYDRRPPPPQT